MIAQERKKKRMRGLNRMKMIESFEKMMKKKEQELLLEKETAGSKQIEGFAAEIAVAAAAAAAAAVAIVLVEIDFENYNLAVDTAVGGGGIGSAAVEEPCCNTHHDFDCHRIFGVGQSRLQRTCGLLRLDSILARSDDLRSFFSRVGFFLRCFAKLTAEKTALV